MIRIVTSVFGGEYGNLSYAYIELTDAALAKIFERAKKVKLLKEQDSALFKAEFWDGTPVWYEHTDELDEFLANSAPLLVEDEFKVVGEQIKLPLPDPARTECVRLAATPTIMSATSEERDKFYPKDPEDKDQ